MTTRSKTANTLAALLLMAAFLTTPNAEARPPQARELCGVIQGIDAQNHTLTVQSPKRDQPATFAVKNDTRFIKDWKFSDSNSLKEGLRACVYYRSPFFGKPFVTKVVWVKQN